MTHSQHNQHYPAKLDQIQSHTCRKVILDEVMLWCPFDSKMYWDSMHHWLEVYAWFLYTQISSPQHFLLTVEGVVKPIECNDVSGCQVDIWRSGTFITKKTVRISWPSIKLWGGFWTQEMSLRLPNFNHSVAVERWSVVCECATHPDLTSKHITGSHYMWRGLPGFLHGVSTASDKCWSKKACIQGSFFAVSCFSLRWLSSKHNMWKPTIWCEPEWGSVCRGEGNEATTSVWGIGQELSQ